MADKTVRAMKDRKWEDVQQKAFTAWLNEYLAQRDLACDDIVTGLESGVELINFLEVLLQKKIKQKWFKNPPSRIHKIQNLSMGLELLTQANVVRVHGVSAEDFVDHEKKMILGFLWTLYKHFRIASIRVGDKHSDAALLEWAQQVTEGYDDVGTLESYTNSFGNGKAFLALVDKFVGGDPEKVEPYNSFDKVDREKNLQAAFTKAQEHMKIPMLLEPEEVAENDVDERAMMLYLSLFFHAFQAKEAQGQTEEEIRREHERQAALAAEADAKARLADDLQAENASLQKKLQEMTDAFALLQSEKADLEDNDAVLSEKVLMLQKLLDEEAAAREKEAAGRAKAEKEVADLKDRLARLEASLADSQGGAEALAEFKSQLEGKVGSLEGEISTLEEELASERAARKSENDSNSNRNATELAALRILKKNLTEHMEDLHRWEHFLNVPGGVVDLAGDFRPTLLADITDKNFDDQLKEMAMRLSAENDELEEKLKAKEAEQAVTDAHSSAKGKKASTDSKSEGKKASTDSKSDKKGKKRA